MPLSARMIAVITRLTFREARRRKMLWLAMAMGVVFVGMYAAGFYFTWKDFTDFSSDVGSRQAEYGFFANLLVSAGLYVVNFLVVMVTALTTVGAISAEIDSNTVHAIAAKPIRRTEILIGKWLGHACMLAIYTALMTVGVILTGYLISGYFPRQAAIVLLILILESLTILSLTMLGSTLFSTLANGVGVFMLYGLAFVGGWVEQIGSLLGSQTAADIGIISSLLMPTEALWRYAAGMLQESSSFFREITPFSVASQPTLAFVIYSVIYTAATLGAAVWCFNRRDF
nr:ABC transporter permease [Anaerolineae bacterium]